MNESDPLHWLIFLLSVLIAVLALHEPSDRELWGDEEDDVREREEPPRRA